MYHRDTFRQLELNESTGYQIVINENIDDTAIKS